MKKLITPLIISTLLASCSHSEGDRKPSSLAIGMGGMLIESQLYYRSMIPTNSNATPTPLSKSEQYLDIRGVGDSAWAYGGPPELWARRRLPLATGSFAEATRNAAPELPFTSGHLNFVNFETVVGTECTKIGTPDFYFLTHPAQIQKAHEFGFNLFSLSNNHANDCHKGPNAKGTVVSGPLMTASNLDQQASLAKGQGFAWHGTGREPWNVSTKTFMLKGRPVKVALGTLFIGWANKEGLVTASEKSWAEVEEAIGPMMESFDDSDAQIKILSIHTQDASKHKAKEAQAFLSLKLAAEKFIMKHDGHIVFGSGPHTGAGIKVYEKPAGDRGVVFTSLGNFIHPGLTAKPDNYMGRVLMDPETFQIKEVQALPFQNTITGRSIGNYQPGTPGLDFCSLANLQQVDKLSPTDSSKWLKQNCSGPLNTNFVMKLGTTKVRGESKGFWWASFP